MFIDLDPNVCLFQSLVTIEGNKLIHIQKWEGKETSLVREVNGNSLTLVSRACEVIVYPACDNLCWLDTALFVFLKECTMIFVFFNRTLFSLFLTDVNPW